MATKSIDQLLDLLIDALEERKGARVEQDHAEFVKESAASPSPDPLSFDQPALQTPPTTLPEPTTVIALPPDDAVVETQDFVLEPDELRDDRPMLEEEWVKQPEIETSSEPVEYIPTIDNMPRTMVRLFIALLVVVAFANLQLFDITRLNALFASNNTGDTTVRFARDGMLLQGEGLKVYLMEDNKRRWITTKEAFEASGYRWGAVRRVSEDYLAQFELGEPIYIAVKCPDSPHVFALDTIGSTQRVRRWISDIETFEAMGFKWSEIDQTHCGLIRRLPDGEPFPVGVDRPIPFP